MKMNVIFTGLLAIALSAAAPAFAALSITNGDISGGHFIYDLSFDELANSTVFDNDVFSQSNVSVIQQGTGINERRYVAANTGETSASLVYAFDFSGTSWLPEAVTFKTYLFAVDDASNTYKIEADYSLNGVDWSLLRVIDTSSTTGNQTTVGDNTLDFSSLGSLPDTVYYRVTYTALSGTVQNTHTQWSRSADGQSNFSADFTVIPEPYTTGLLFGASALVLIVLKRRIKSQKA